MGIKRMLGIGMLIAATTLVGCGKVTPTGTTVIIRKPSGETKVIEKGVYKGWGRDKVYFVDNKLQNYEEDDMKILCADNINMNVDIKALLSFKASKDNPEALEFIQSKIPSREVSRGEISGYELSLNDFYLMAIQPVVRNAAREVIAPYNTDDIRPNRKSIQYEIDGLVRKRLGELNYPIELSAIMISNIDYPDIVRQQREAIKNAQLEDQRKAALAEAEIAQAQREVSIETERAKVRMIKAQAQADENEILTSSLTPEFLRWRQMEMLENVGGDANLWIVPWEAMSPDLVNTSLIREAVSDN